MKKLILALLIGIFTIGSVGLPIGGPGPAPNSGDGVSVGPNVPDSPGPAPNSGDGVSDGSGF